MADGGSKFLENVGDAATRFRNPHTKSGLTLNYGERLKSVSNKICAGNRTTNVQLRSV